MPNAWEGREHKEKKRIIKLNKVEMVTSPGHKRADVTVLEHAHTPFLSYVVGTLERTSTLFLPGLHSRNFQPVWHKKKESGRD
jgi:hypothetical protein